MYEVNEINKDCKKNNNNNNIAGPKFVEQNGIQIISIQKSQVLTMHEYKSCIIVGISVKQNGIQNFQIIGCHYSIYVELYSMNSYM